MGLVVGLAVAGVLAGLYFSHHPRGPRSNSAGLEHRLAPDFTLPLVEAGQLRLSSYHGKVILLDFWATWCVPCREETPHFVAVQEKYSDRGFQIIGVSMDDSPDPVRTFVQQFRVNYPVVMGTAEVGSAYGGVLGLPIAFLIDREGRVQAKHMGATDASVFEKEIAGLLAQ